MHPRASIASRVVTRRVGISIIVLTVLSVGLLVATVWLFIGLRDSRDAVARSIREDAVWAAFQTDREAARLLESVLTARVSGNTDDISTRYDLLYSRLGLLKSGKYGITLGEQSGVGEIAAAVVGLVLDLDPEVASLGDKAINVDQEAALDHVLEDVREVRVQTGKLIVAANAAVNDMRVAEREAALQTYLKIGVAVAGLTLVLILIVGLLVLQLIHISRTGRQMAKLSERNAKSAHAAEAANRAKSAFLATMSHEIRTPLNAIIGMADVLRLSDLDAGQTKQLGIIRQAGDVLLDVINDILDYSKLEAGAVTIERASTSLPDIIDSVRAIMESRAAAASLGFEMVAPAVAVTVDAARLRQVLLNLVGNAIKFTRHGSVSVTATLQGELLRIEVCDTGPGIAEDQFDRLFRDFSQLDSSSTRAFGGTGLGLAICRRLTEAMGGTIGVNSVVGTGSTFWIELPASPATLLPLAPSVAPPAQPTAAEPGPEGTVLVVDDNDINRQVAGALLRSLGWQVECAKNGAEAVELMAGSRYDLVLMDMQMPVLDGLAATRVIRESGDSTMIVGLTANAFQSDRDACLEAGMDDHLAKPVTREKLAYLIAGKRPAALSGGDVVPPGLPSTPAIEINREQQEALVSELGREQFDLLVESFLEDGLRMVEQARDALRRQDAADYDRIMHTLKGAALTLGFTSIGEAAAAQRTVPAELADATPVADAFAALKAA
jgi:signal transduction histidine kinase/DNA-binding NarL/FixJ family response regulator